WKSRRPALRRRARRSLRRVWTPREQAWTPLEPGRTARRGKADRRRARRSAAPMQRNPAPGAEARTRNVGTDHGGACFRATTWTSPPVGGNRLLGREPGRHVFVQNARKLGRDVVASQRGEQAAV